MSSQQKHKRQHKSLKFRTRGNLHVPRFGRLAPSAIAPGGLDEDRGCIKVNGPGPFNGMQNVTPQV